jgi:hypothetical protein
MSERVGRRLTLALVVAGLLVLAVGGFEGAKYGYSLQTVGDLIPASDTELCPRYISAFSFGNSCLNVDRSQFSPTIPPWPYIGGNGPCDFTGCSASVPAGAPQINAQASGCTAVVVQVGDTTYRNLRYQLYNELTTAAPYVAGLMIVFGLLVYPPKRREPRLSWLAVGAATLAIAWALGLYTFLKFGSDVGPSGLLTGLFLWLASTIPAAICAFPSRLTRDSDASTDPLDFTRGLMGTGAALVLPLIGIAGWLIGNGLAGC